MIGGINKQGLSNLVFLILASFMVASCSLFPKHKPHVYGIKDMQEYKKSEVFIIADSKWENVLSLVPVTVWSHDQSIFKSSKVKKYPTLIYHKESSDKFDADSIIHFLQKYKPKRVTIVGKPPRDLALLIASYPSMEFGAGLRPNQVRIIKPKKLIKFWKKYKAVVYANDKYADSLIAATYASLLNVPLIVKNSVLDKPANRQNKRLICVGEPIPAANCDENYSQKSLQRRYLELTRTKQVVFVNSKDLELGISGSFQPEKSPSPIGTTFAKLSLGAPYLASAKKAVLLSIKMNANDCGPYGGSSDTQFQDADDFVKNRIESLFSTNLLTKVRPKYLTIVASPKAIPYWSDCGNSYTGSADWQYGSFDNVDPDLNVGRIYAQTVSDVSSYIARSIFYKNVYQSTYTSTDYTGLAIASPNFSHDQDNAQEIRDKTVAAGYNTICFTWYGATDQPNCDVYTNIVLADYQERQFISFADHGSPTGWGGTLDSEDIPWLDLPYTLSLACDTNNFWSGLNETFGPTWIRKGGLSYHASIPSTSGYNWEKWAIQELTEATRQNLGQINTNLINRTDYSSMVKRHYMLLGDPTLRPHSKEVTW